MGDDNKNVADEAKSFSQELVATLGLVELILGGVSLYGLWLIMKDRSVNILFPSTGNSIVDMGLQLFAAALVGKIIYLIVALPIAVVRFILKRITSYYSPLEKALGRFYDAATLSEIKATKVNLIDVALKHLSLADPTQRVMLERHRIKIIVAFGTCVVILIFFTYLMVDRYQDTPWILLVTLPIIFLVFIFIGFLEQLSLFSEVTQALISLHKVEERRKELNQKQN